MRPALLFLAVLAPVLLVLAALSTGGGAGEDQSPPQTLTTEQPTATQPPASEPPEPEPEPEPPATFRPVTIEIPALSVTAPMDPQVPDADNVLGVPSDPKRLGWREAGALPGAEVGTLLAYGHVVNRGYGRGVLYHLSDLAVGDDIVLAGADGERVVYRVTENSSMHKDDMPANEMLALEGPHRMALYTCSGSPDATGHRQYRVVVWAERVTPVHRA